MIGAVLATIALGLTSVRRLRDLRDAPRPSSLKSTRKVAAPANSSMVIGAGGHPTSPYAGRVAKPLSRSRASSLPSGTLTFLFSDIEGSTRLATALGAGWTPILERHQALLRTAFTAAGGVEIATEGDSFFVVFPSVPRAVEGAIAAQRALVAEPWPAAVGTIAVRIGLHTGEGVLGGDNYVGLDVHRAARISAAAHGGQVLVSGATAGLVQGSLPSGVSLRDLGEHRLKDLERPERLFQVDATDLRADFPPPRTLEAPTNLPAQITSFVGREEEVRAVQQLLKGTRLLTLTGPGGTGKTRLSLRVAEDVRTDFPGGTFLVELAPITDPSLIPATIAQSIGLREEPRRPVVDTVKDYLRDRRVLLVLDNFEQVVAGAAVVGELLGAAAGLTVLTSSREVLHVRGEQEYPVPPLGLPDIRNLPPIAELSHYDAVALFVQRARSVRPDFAVTNENAPAVAAICARLDGLPLAIELAAARTKVFTPDAILARLEKSLSLLTSGVRDVPERQRTLRGAIDWSYDLLDPTEQALFRRLAIFVGGCTIDSAAAVCDPNGELGVDMLDALVSFVDKSLLRQNQADQGEPRFLMLETIREYGLERLGEGADDEAVRHQHQDHFSAVAQQAELELMGARPKELLDRLEIERDNLRAAIQRAADDGRIQLALDMAAALWRFWQQRGHLVEGRETLRGLLDRPAAAGPTGARARALGGLGGVAYWQADIAGAGHAYAEALEIEREIDDPHGLAGALYNAGFVAALTGDHVGARADYDEAIRIYETIGDRKGLVNVREALAFSMYHSGEFSTARALQEENLAAFRSSGEPFRVAGALSLLTGMNLKDRAFGAAHDTLGEAIGMFRKAGDMQRVVSLLIMAAALAIAENDPKRAALLSGAAAVLKEPLGDIATPIQLLGLEDPAPAARSELGDDAFEATYGAGRAMSLDQMIDLVQAGTALPRSVGRPSHALG
jgi:predicted ATPase/class 3 adenylate cyclase